MPIRLFAAITLRGALVVSQQTLFPDGCAAVSHRCALLSAKLPVTSSPRITSPSLVSLKQKAQCPVAISLVPAKPSSCCFAPSSALCEAQGKAPQPLGQGQGQGPGMGLGTGVLLCSCPTPRELGAELDNQQKQSQAKRSDQNLALC